MRRNRTLSTPARALLAALLAAGGRWSYGYELATLTGIKSGTLYPLLVRLEGQGYLEAEWQAPAAVGRPPRHAYRLTAAGRQLAYAEVAATAQPAEVAGWRPGKAAS
jgi:PadR family transcriptional regulator, regulatory protein PadR